MADSGQKKDSQPAIQFVKTTGSPVIVGQRDRAARIREGMSDLRMAIDGCITQQTHSGQSVALDQSIAALARACSIFLRKMVIGDRNDRRTRLLNDDTCRNAGLEFSRIRRIPRDRRTLTLVPVDISGGYMQATKLDEETGEPEVVHIIPAGAQRLSIAVEWPLPGMADWTGQPTPEAPWAIKADGLLDPRSSPKLDCDSWLGQQLVMFDNRGISLKDVIRVTVNTEAAHSPPVSRLMLSEGENDEARFRVVKDRAVHILSHIKVCGVRYSHAIVIEAALYLYRELARNGSIERPEGAENIPVFCFVPNAVFSSNQDWLRFSGGLAISFGGQEQSISHRIRAPR